MTAARCRFCGGSATTAFEVGDRNRECSDQLFAYARCASCRTLSLEQVPDDLSRYYPDSYYELLDAAQLERLAPIEAHKVAFLRDHVDPGRLVEIGPGTGLFAHAARTAGFEVTAVEMDARTCGHLRDVVGIEAVESDDPTTVLATLPPSRAVAMWHVLEHLGDPAATIDAVAANLEPGGVLAVSVPNPDAFQFRVLGTRWAHVDAPRHLALIPFEALVERAAAGGLRCVESTSSDPSGRHLNLFGWEYGMRRRPAAGPPAKAVSLAALGLTLAMRPVEHRGLRGATYTAIFMKEGR